MKLATRHQRLRLSALALVAAAALCVPAAQAARATTLPSKTMLAVVVLTDKGILFGLYQGTLQQGFLPVGGMQVPRGDFVRINIFNRGKKVHNFTVFGKKTPPIKPGGKAHLFKAALARGTFAYGSTLDKGKAFHGSLKVV